MPGYVSLMRFLVGNEKQRTGKNRGRFRLFALAVLLGSPAYADCSDGLEEFASCKIDGQDSQVSVCFDDTTVTYRFGPVSGPAELEMSEPVKMIDYEPWPGMGSSIWESVTFRNADHQYRLVAGFERIYEEPTDEVQTEHFGHLEIHRGSEKVAELLCDPATVSYGFSSGLDEMKAKAGLEWDSSRKEWTPKSD